MAELIWTREATSRLEEIYQFIATDSPSSARKVVASIYEKVQMLRTFPRIGQRYEPITDREVREVRYGHYRIVYLHESPDRITILGVFHGAMDIEQYLR